MNRTGFPLLALLALAALQSACSSPQIYGGGQAWQRLECNRIQDSAERRRCMDSTALSHDDYKRQAEAAKGQR
ncbi:hypothetical protein [Rubrivivax sp. A210]|uniref:hypothetical protein n=1 Tax=Rubrivivax sp. A210 TaxID=2772301 RepID=UPI0019195823|nr:hypothetical protein [Rubrivivax sp. A210]